MPDSHRFTFFAGVSGESDEIIPDHIRVSESLQSELSELFEKQASQFLPDGIEPVKFNPKENYRLEREQVFVIPDFPLPQAYVDAALKPHQAESFKLDSLKLPRVATVFAADTINGSVNRLLFQQFRSTQILDRRFALLSSGDTFNRISHNGFSLASELSAVWQNGKLYFRSFSIVARFLDLEEFEPKATIEEITEFVASEHFAFENEDTKASIFNTIEGDSFLRRRIASIISNRILDEVKPVTAAKKATAFGINIQIKRPDNKSRIALPTVKKDLKAVVKFLNEEYFHGELTERLYEANSLRQHQTEGG